MLHWEIAFLDYSGCELTTNYGSWSPHVIFRLYFYFIYVYEITRSDSLVVRLSADLTDCARTIGKGSVSI